MKKAIIILVFLLSGCFLHGPDKVIKSAAASEHPFGFRGYLRAMPTLQLDRDFSNPSLGHTFHNRLNFNWDIVSNWRIVLEGKNKLYYNEMFLDYPEAAQLITRDNGLANMSWRWHEQNGWLGHTMIDRLFVDWQQGSWQIRAGRQRINWGITLVSNPNDLFNTYSFFEVDYPERPGADAVRIQYHTGFASRMEVAWNPSSNKKESTAAFLWANNYQGYDVQIITGYYRHRAALGMGWAGHIKGAGFKGEATWFYDLEKSYEPRGNVVLATGLDYVFGNGSFAVLEFLYNGGYSRSAIDRFIITQPLSADNIMFSKYAMTLNLQHPFSNILQGGLAFMALPDIDAVFLMPQISLSIMRNLDMECVGQVFAGGQNSIFEEGGSAWFVSLQYSF